MGTGGDDCDYAEIPLAISASWRENELTEGKESRRDAKNAKKIVLEGRAPRGR